MHISSVRSKSLSCVKLPTILPAFTVSLHMLLAVFSLLALPSSGGVQCKNLLGKYEQNYKVYQEIHNPEIKHL